MASTVHQQTDLHFFYHEIRAWSGREDHEMMGDLLEPFGRRRDYSQYDLISAFMEIVLLI